MGKPKTFLKFDKDLVLEGQYQEAEVIPQLGVPIGVSDLIEILNKLKKGHWVQVDGFYYVLFNPQIVTPLRGFCPQENHT